MTRNPVNNDRVADVLPALRREARVSQVELAKLARLSRETINLIERDATRPKVDTLRKLSDGLATDGAGVRDAEKADAYYGRLMRAAGNWPVALPDAPSAPAPDNGLKAKLEETFGHDARAITDFLEQADRLGNTAATVHAYYAHAAEPSAERAHQLVTDLFTLPESEAADAS